MSKFLGPIHHWLFNKIILCENLEKDLLNIYKEKYHENIEQISHSMQKKYGYFIENKSLEKLIDTNNIHGWLQEKISIAETRQAAFLAKIFEQYGKDAVEIAISIYEKQGVLCGEDAKSNHNVEDAPSIYKALNDYILDGMPCDHVNNILVAEPEKLQWTNIRCLHKSYWESVGADIDTFYQLRNTWIKAFIEHANKNYTYTVNDQIFTIIQK